MIVSMLKLADSRMAKLDFAASIESWKWNGGSTSVDPGQWRVVMTLVTMFGGQTSGPGSEKATIFSCWFRAFLTRWIGRELWREPRYSAST